VTRPSDRPDVERAVAAQRARLDHHLAAHRALCETLAQLTARHPDARTGTGRRLASVHEGLQRAERMLEAWRRVVAEAEQTLALPRPGADGLVRVIALLCDETVSLEAAALRKEDRRPPGMAPATHFSLSHVEENVEAELRTVRRAAEQIDRRRRAAYRATSLFTVTVGGAADPDALRARVATIVDLAENDPLELSQAELGAVYGELAAARCRQLTILIDQLEAEENELRGRLTATSVRAAAGFRARLRVLETLCHGRSPEADALPQELTSLAKQTEEALARVQSLRASAMARTCVRPCCSGRGVIEEDGTCGLCFLPPEKEPS
jgi:hypothetical protein